MVQYPRQSENCDLVLDKNCPGNAESDWPAIEGKLGGRYLVEEPGFRNAGPLFRACCVIGCVRTAKMSEVRHGH